jgi:hypothetical protein
MNDALAVFDGNRALSPQESRELVVQMQERLLEMEQAEIVTYHCFKPGIYERTIKVPPWTVLTGAAHKTAYKVRLEKGVIAVNTDEGVKTLVGPCEFEVEAGFQRAGRVFDEEVVWTDVYANPDNCRDIDALEERLYEVPACGLGDMRQLSKGELTWQDS